MKELLLLRHAKSDWGDPGLPDHQRPLAARGERDAPRIGEFLAANAFLPDLVISSPAERAKATAKRVLKAAGYTGDLQYDERIYMADAGSLLRLVRGLPDAANRVLLIGHNPGFEELAASLCGGAVRMTTAALACIELADTQWATVEPDSGSLLWQVNPKVLA